MDTSGPTESGPPAAPAAPVVPAAREQFTLVVFHAHPDDEALLTSGTMARASAEGHRVVLVVATDGGVGLVASDFLAAGEDLAARRRAELRRSATALGCARVEWLGYTDSGLHGDEGGNASFVRAGVDEAARRLADLLVDERADAVTSYDATGGYGHPDHVRLHEVARRAAELAGTPLVLEATVDRDLLTAALRWVGRVYRFPAEFDPTVFDRAYAPRAAITHRVDVRRYTPRKRASMAAHSSQATADGADRTLAAFLRLPRPLYRRVFGREWFIEVGRTPGPPLDDIFVTLRGRPGRS